MGGWFFLCVFLMYMFFFPSVFNSGIYHVKLKYITILHTICVEIGVYVCSRGVSNTNFTSI